jgi:AcrR family transcriptional regulator
MLQQMTTVPSPSKDARPYHHGDLPRALLEAAVQAIDEVGPAAVSLRDLARRTGVSHAAPAHHFGDKAGLLTAVATDGFERLAATLGEAYQATGSFLEVGVAYVRFAVTHRAYFEVMFRPELYRSDDPELVRAREQARALLYPPAAEAANAPDIGGDIRAGVAAWSLVHGLATLWLNHNLPPQLGDDPEQIARDVAHYLF